jgi:asparagine synthase (glutamine-hydrolysing)
MCGIAGILSLSDMTPRASDVVSMVGAIAHRGPDDEAVHEFGPLVLGHRRLSILDPTPAGNQPMRSADGRYRVIHNGEIYNFLELADELRAAGHTFRTESDTEVLLTAYAAWGPECVTRFNGIWAFVIWDALEEQLFLSRDRLGVKPLFLAEGSGQLAFASEIKALLALSWVDRTPDAAPVRDFLMDGLVDHTSHTFFEAIRRLPAAHNMLVKRGSRRVWRYWAPSALSGDASTASSPNDARTIEAFRALVIDSVAVQLRSDVPIGSCLSGGLDSSTIVTVADGLRRGTIATAGLKHHERDRHPQMAFFASFSEPGIDERPFVDAVIRATGVELRATAPDAGKLLETLGDVVWQQDEPFGSTSIVAQYHVMRLANEAGVKVLLDGQGADELLAGYPANAAPRYGGALRSGEAPGLIRRWLHHGSPAPAERVLWYALTNGRPPPTLARPSRALRGRLGDRTSRAGRLSPARVRRDGTILARTMWRDVESAHLPGLLRFEDRNSMAFGIEARVPFLDHRLVEAALALPDRLKITDGEHKVALRRAMTGMVPDAVLDRRDKIGFSTPEASWLRDSLPVLVHLAEKPSAESMELLKPGTVAWAMERWRAGDLARDVFWRLLSLELWLRIVVRGDRSGLASR